MKKEETALKNVFSSILSNEGFTSTIDRIDIQGLRDEPGFHWSNPGLTLSMGYQNKRKLFYRRASVLF